VFFSARSSSRLVVIVAVLRGRFAEFERSGLVGVEQAGALEICGCDRVGDARDLVGDQFVLIDRGAGDHPEPESHRSRAAGSREASRGAEARAAANEGCRRTSSGAHTSL
jgi:hypothetical protein